ncbi:YIP1 family protein [Syntrophomonas wolfei]|nr:YIP1 family protein [Syntrophomonas wolfei]
MPDNPALSSPEALDMAANAAIIGGIAGALLTPLLFALIVALLLKLFNALAGDKVPYRKLFSVSVYAYLPLLLSSLIGLALGLTTPAENFGSISISLYLLFPPDTYTFPALLAAQINPFILWSLYLAALGGAILMKSEVKKVGSYIFLLWLIYALASSYFGAASISNLYG